LAPMAPDAAPSESADLQEKSATTRNIAEHVYADCAVCGDVTGLANCFKRNEILPGWHVEVSDEKVYSHRDDDAGVVLLTLPVVLTLTPA
jgi:hypothetical protein